jgi:putative DNA primase/helicase
MGPKPQGLAYRLIERLVDGQAGQSIVTSYVAWDSAPVAVSADEALRASEDRSDRSASIDAEEFLRDRLSSGAVVPAKDGEEHARALGIAPRTLARARKKLGVLAEKGGLKEGWTWRLPSEDCQTHPKNANKGNGSLRPSLAAFGAPSDPFPDFPDLPESLRRTPQSKGRSPDAPDKF